MDSFLCSIIPFWDMDGRVWAVFSYTVESGEYREWYKLWNSVSKVACLMGATVEGCHILAQWGTLVCCMLSSIGGRGSSESLGVVTFSFKDEYQSCDLWCGTISDASIWYWQYILRRSKCCVVFRQPSLVRASYSRSVAGSLWVLCGNEMNACSEILQANWMGSVMIMMMPTVSG